ncbi:sensor histidine kinase [Atopobacter phocae]|uniref:sensor histidine kinase n=1 Tax=Atopobacter phocae TaxID=136492 RepID=UPI00046F1A04|nr:HAMP domain-containing sensor histidine kinase [Atopobacter phocae]
MNIFKKSILKFILSFLFIILIDILLLFFSVNYIRNHQSALQIIETISSNINYSNDRYKVNPVADRLIKEEKLWVMIIDKDSGREKFNIHKPDHIDDHFDYADVVKFSRYYLNDYPIFSQVKEKDNDIYLIAFPKNRIVRYNSNYFEINRIKIFPFIILSIIFLNCLFCFVLYTYSVTFLNRKMKPIINAIATLPNGLNKEITSVQELDRLTLAVNSANQKLRTNEAFKENWISGIAHDIKTPLSVIVSNTALAIEKTNNEYLLKHLQTTLMESYYIQNLINDLNIFARLTNGNLKLNLELVDIIPFFKEIIIQIINQEIWEAFNFEFIPDSRLTGKKMKIEKALVSRVFHNLIYNSVLHNPLGCDIKIILEYVSDHRFNIIVRDNGAGVSPERLKSINDYNIEEFNFDISGVRRSGMGLKISQQIIDLHDGQLILTSQQGEYFQSSINLPLHSTHTQDN